MRFRSGGVVWFVRRTVVSLFSTYLLLLLLFFLFLLFRLLSFQRSIQSNISSSFSSSPPLPSLILPAFYPIQYQVRSSPTKLVCAVGSRNGTEETKLLVLDFDVTAPSSLATPDSSGATSAIEEEDAMEDSAATSGLPYAAINGADEQFG